MTGGDNQVAAYQELARRFNNWPTLVDVREDRNPLIALLAFVETLDAPNREADRYIQACTNSSALPLWRGRGKALPSKKFRYFTSDLQAAVALYTMFPGGEVPATIPSTPLECTKDALRRLVARMLNQETPNA